MDHEIFIGMDGEVFAFCINTKNNTHSDGYVLLIARWDQENNNYGPFFSFEEVLNRKDRSGILQYSEPYLEIIEYGDSYERAINKFNRLKIFI